MRAPTPSAMLRRMDADPRFRVRSADELPTEALHEAIAAAFSDYLIGPLRLPLDAWPRFLARQGVRLELSRAALDDDGAVLAFALAAPRTSRASWRLATMGARPAARGLGVAPALLADFLARATDAGAAEVELEVFAQNERARRLYERAGFVVRDELWGVTGRVTPGPPLALRELDWAETLGWLAEAEAGGLEAPHQQTRASLAAGPEQAAWSWGSALVTRQPLPDAPAIFQLGVVIDRSPAQVDLAALVSALAARHPSIETWRAPQIVRPGLGGEALLRVGLAREPLHQLWMQRAL